MPGSKGVVTVTSDNSTLKIDVCAVPVVSGFCLRLARGRVGVCRSGFWLVRSSGLGQAQPLNATGDVGEVEPDFDAAEV
jgi:hypothetical protein